MDMVQMGEAGDAVRDKPDGEQHRQHEHPRPGIYHEHDAGHHAQDPGDEREDGAKARIAFHLDVQDDIGHPHNYSG